MTRALASVLCCLLFQILLSVAIFADNLSAWAKSSGKSAVPLEIVWKTFTTPGREIKVLMPDDVHRYYPKGKESDSEEENGDKWFEACVRDDKPYVSMDISSVNGMTLAEHTKHLKEGFAPSDGYKVTDIGDCQGTGWKGKKFSAEDGKYNYTALVAMEPTARKLVYIETCLPPDDNMTRKMLDSLVIDKKVFKANRAKFKTKNMSLWKTFTTPKKEISIKLPTPVESYKPKDEKTRKSDRRGHVERYRANYGPDTVWLTVYPRLFDSMKTLADSYKEGFEKEGYKVKDLGDCKGDGWTGNRFVASTEVDLKNCFFARNKAETVVIFIESNFTPGDNLTSEMVNSLVIDEKKLKEKQEAEDKADFEKNLNNPWYLIGNCAFCLGAIFMLVGIIWLVIAAFRTHWAWGLSIFFLQPFGSIIFLCVKPRRAWKPFVLYLIGITLGFWAVLSTPIF